MNGKKLKRNQFWFHKKTSAVPTKSVTIITGNDIKKELTKQRNKMQFQLTSDISSNIKEIEPLVECSKSIDELIQHKLYSKAYTFYQPLLITNPYQISPLSALIIFYTKRAQKVKIVVNGNSTEGDIESWLSMTQYHRIPVLGLYPNVVNKVNLSLYDKNDQLLEQHEMKIPMGPLPTELVDVVHRNEHTKPSLMGLTLISGKGTPYPFAFDSFGTIRYYLNFQTNSHGIFPISQNRFLVMSPNIKVPTYEEPHSAALYEMDYLGRIYQTYYIGSGVCQDIQEKVPSGNLLMISNSYEGYMGDKIIEMDRQTGEIVKTLALQDLFGNTFCKKSNWANINSVSYDDPTDTLLLSIRSLNAIIKISWKTNEVKWIISNPKYFRRTPYKNKVLKPTADFDWHYQQNAVYQIIENLDGDSDTEHIIFFDNHPIPASKLTNPLQETYSYVKIYTVNSSEKIVSLRSQYQVAQSKVSSNGILDLHNQRLYIMSGCLASKKEAERSLVCEIDTNTNEIINQYGIAYTFHRGYPFNFDYTSLAEPCNQHLPSWIGELNFPIRSTRHIPKPEKKLQKKLGVSFRKSDDILFVQGKDHQIKEVIFAGKKRQYVYDLTLTDQQKPDLYKRLTYSTPIPLKRLEKDTYNIYVRLKNHAYYTAKILTIYNSES